ncbi:glycosyltransferase family 2 protein [uncultured Bacteroides sp.]|uniref:glycosyltransferase family 2 protein n=1 Tax=uncultured Bacteroides sp. TaxID=162156 RepID=UPI002AAB7756|nr:glycosyltransferase family 2 protein [uncultured Bacteroides sp.]
MNYPKITVVTPSYNQGQFIERTIISILSQNYPNLEYFIIDGGSKDSTVEIIKKYSEKISYWVSERDNGQTDAINKGMQRATGDIVCYINSDDVLLPGALKYVGDFFLKNHNVDFLMGISLEIDLNDFIIKQTHSIINKWFAKHGCYNINQQGMFWKRSLFEKIGYFRTDFHACMDAEFVIRALTNNISIKVINIPLGAIRVYSTTKTAIGGNIWDKDWAEICNEYNGFVRSKKSVYYLIYGFVKLINGYYFNDYRFMKKYKNISYTKYLY